MSHIQLASALDQTTRGRLSRNTVPLCHDISSAARDAAFDAQVSITSDLWQKLAGDEPFESSDFRLAELAWFLRFALLRAGQIRLPRQSFSWTLLFRVAFDTAHGPSRFRVRARLSREANQPARILMTVA